MLFDRGFLYIEWLLCKILEKLRVHLVFEENRSKSYHFSFYPFPLSLYERCVKFHRMYVIYWKLYVLEDADFLRKDQCFFYFFDEYLNTQDKPSFG